MDDKNKPLDEWSLRELVDHCSSVHSCNGCPFADSEKHDCRLSKDPPYAWKLTFAGDISALSKKPRLAWILGLNVGEKFAFKDDNMECPNLAIAEDGVMRDKANGALAGTFVCRVVNHPEGIVHRQTMTRQEIAICKAMGAKWVSRDKDQSSIWLWQNRPNTVREGYYAGGNSAHYLATVKPELFPSIRPGDCASVDEA